MSSPGLAGRGILVTRPAGQAEALVRQLAGLGACPVLFPAIEIAPPGDAETLLRAIDTLASADLAVFVSPTSVEQSWPLIQSRHGGWPAGLRLAAIGTGSARALRAVGGADILVAEDGADSESLLARSELAAMNGRQVVIVRGEGGRELLAHALRERGAHVSYAECYRRRRPDVDPVPLLADWRNGRIDAVTVTSREIFANLVEMLGARGWALLKATPLFAPHPRIAGAARDWGVATVVVSEPGDAGLVSALSDWFNARHV